LIKGLTEVATARPADPIAFLANYLYNFTNQPKPRTSQTSSRSITKSVAEVEPQPQQVQPQKMEAMARPEVPVTKKPQFNDNAGDDSADESSANSSAPSSEDRDEHGQSMLHFACARSHGKNALYQLIEETGTSVTYRDELYRTARDVSLQATQPDNAKEIDRYVLNLAARGHYDIFGNMLLDGYDHIVDVVDADGSEITEVARNRGHTELAQFLSTIRDFEVSLALR
jgi:Dpy-30 motif